MADEENETEYVDPLAGDPVEEPAVTGRPVDVAPENTTFADRAKAGSKAVASDGEKTENKAVKKAAASNK